MAKMYWKMTRGLKQLRSFDVLLILCKFFLLLLKSASVDEKEHHHSAWAGGANGNDYPNILRTPSEMPGFTPLHQ